MYRKVTTEWKGGMAFESDDPGGKTVVMDTGVEGSDERFGISPKAAMLSALASCSGLDVVSVLEKMKVTDYEFIMDVEGELTQEHPKYFHKVKIDYHFTGENLNQKKIKKAIDLSVEKYCGVMEMFRQFAEVSIEIHHHNK
jgi:putative redox protein